MFAISVSILAVVVILAAIGNRLTRIADALEEMNKHAKREEEKEKGG